MEHIPLRIPWAVHARLAVLGLAIAALVLLSACAATTKPATDAVPATAAGTTAASAMTATQQRDGGQVSVAVTWNGAESGTSFEVAMDTHSVDLDGADLIHLAVLETPGGELAPSSWDAPRGGHHRAGTLIFPATTADGSSTIGSGPFGLVIRDVAGVPARAFQWQP